MTFFTPKYSSLVGLSNDIKFVVSCSDTTVKTSKISELLTRHVHTRPRQCVYTTICSSFKWIEPLFFVLSRTQTHRKTDMSTL